jgi:hypothetical protein
LLTVEEEHARIRISAPSPALPPPSALEVGDTRVGLALAVFAFLELKVVVAEF